MSNYPAGFNGHEGEEEQTYLFDVGGEIEIVSTSEEYAEEDFLDMTIREALENGLKSGGLSVEGND